MICADDPHFALRHQLVEFARTHGIKAAARHFLCSRNTVRKWLRRFQSQGQSRLARTSRAPLSCPHKTSLALENKVVKFRQQTPGFGARRLIEEFELLLGHNAAQRIINAHHLTRPPKRRHRRKNDLRAVKAAYAPFTRFQMDVKYLTDIPFFWPQMQRNGLPRFQYTIRELSCGAQFLAYSNVLAKTYSTLAVARFLQHLRHHGLDTTKVILTTDLGTEFDGDTLRYRPDSFHLTIQHRFGAEHRFNPPSCPNANADRRERPSHHRSRTLRRPMFRLAQRLLRQNRHLPTLGTTPPAKRFARLVIAPPISSPSKRPTSPQLCSCSTHPFRVSAPFPRGSRCTGARRKFSHGSLPTPLIKVSVAYGHFTVSE